MVSSRPGQRQSKRKHRPMAQLAGDLDAPAVGLHDRLDDRQTHARALQTVALALAAIELVEDHGALQVIDTGAAVGYAGDEPAVPGFAGDEDGCAAGRVLGCVLE